MLWNNMAYLTRDKLISFRLSFLYICTNSRLHTHRVWEFELCVVRGRNGGSDDMCCACAAAALLHTQGTFWLVLYLVYLCWWCYGWLRCLSNTPNGAWNENKPPVSTHCKANKTKYENLEIQCGHCTLRHFPLANVCLYQFLACTMYIFYTYVLATKHRIIWPLMPPAPYLTVPLLVVVVAVVVVIQRQTLSSWSWNLMMIIMMKAMKIPNRSSAATTTHLL